MELAFDHPFAVSLEVHFEGEFEVVALEAVQVDWASVVVAVAAAAAVLAMDDMQDPAGIPVALAHYHQSRNRGH